MKQNSTFTSFLVSIIATLLFTITFLLMTSCSGVKYTYFNKQKVPYMASGETKPANAIPAKPFLNQSKNELKNKVSTQDKKDKQKAIVQDDVRKKEAPLKSGQIFNERSIAKYIPKQLQGVQSENQSKMDRDMLIVVLLIAILVIIAFTGDVLGLLLVALLVLLIYILIKYLGVFN